MSVSAPFEFFYFLWFLINDKLYVNIYNNCYFSPRLLEDRVSRLSDHFSQSHSNDSLSSSTLFMLHEDIHWILLVAGKIMAWGR